jgi:transcription-repair coupling factor (superfamily II helicase)
VDPSIGHDPGPDAEAQDAAAFAVLPPEGVTARRVDEVVDRVFDAVSGHVDVSGVVGSAGAFLAARLANRGRRVVFVTEDLETARRAASDIGFLLHGRLEEEVAEDTGALDVLLLAPSESSPYADVSPDRRAAMARMATLFHLTALPWNVVVVPAGALVRRFVPTNAIRAATALVVAEEEMDRDALIRQLADSGYLRVPMVEDPGSFAVRGALVDVWPASSEEPVRIDFYGELVVTIKPFDPIDQKTRDAKLPQIHLPPAREAILAVDNVARARRRVTEAADAIDWPTTKARALVEDVVHGRAFFGAEGFLPAYFTEMATLFDYVGADAVFMLEDPSGITNAVHDDLEHAEADAAAKGKTPHFPASAHFQSEDAAADTLGAHRVVSLHRTPVRGASEQGLARFESSNGELDLAARDHEALTRAVKAARTARGRTATLEPLATRIRAWRDYGLRIFVTARAETQAERLVSLLRHQGIECTARSGTFDPRWLDERDSTAAAKATIVVGALARGVVLPAEGIVLVTEEEIFGQRAHRKRERKGEDKSRAFLEDLRSLSVGDFIVHVDHGIGRYLGLVHREVGGMAVDLLAIEYAGGDKLYVPVYRLNQVQKYSGGENAAPKLDRLGGSTFAKTKSRVRAAVRQMADELLRLYAQRKAQLRPPLPPISDDVRAFEATFPFDETPDQARAITAVNTDLEAQGPMDRLVCGDVGFGKTEIALRGAFRMAMEGRQVALLCPTTVLAQQHLRTFEARMEGHPLTIRGMSRFQSKKEQDETLALVKDGRCDIVIGTHRLLSKDVHFKNLGLLIVDEEQRFGVTHKERMKQLRGDVDVLTLTATPIPRTLQMAIGGMRDLSLITTPPADRRAVRTIVTRHDEQVIREAVERELSRGGQVFYVYNRVEGLHEKAARLQVLVPNARIAVGHGQMSRKRTTNAPGVEEKESALEQTMLDFVEGRYDVLVATAIVESGLDIPRANTIVIDRADLFGLAQLYQLRGRVGRSKERAYCYLVVPPPNAMTDESRARIEALERHTELGSGFHIASLDLELRGAGDLLGAEQSGNVASVGFELFCAMLDEAVHDLRGEPIVHEVDPELSFDVEALLPDDYIAEIGVRLSFYKRLASALDEAHVAELAEEMENRFGPPPEVARRFVHLMTIKTELRKLRVLGCEANAKVVTLHLRDDTPLDSKRVLELVRMPKSPYRLTPDMRLTRRFEGSDGSAGSKSGLLNVETMLADLAKYCTT